jgi:hypothetical protein
MCEEAYSYSKVAAAEQHEDLSDTPQEYGEMYRARHYIGRLSSWRKAARNVISLGACFPAILASHEVATVACAEHSGSLFWTPEHDLDALLGRIVPNCWNWLLRCSSI